MRPEAVRYLEREDSRPRATFHRGFVRCASCQNATVGLSLPWVINHDSCCPMIANRKPVETPRERQVRHVIEAERVELAAIAHSTPVG